jgi:hypothetical protein|tara:strand:+ start:2409 stop:3002 length:594 start_codon:yes stop_codon:yes gene_type:complete
MSKLKNIKAVKQMLEGKHKTQTKKTVSFDKKEFVKREVGDVWTDDKGQKWIQKKGYKVKLGKLHKLREDVKKFPNCKKGCKSHLNPGQADLKMKSIHGMCLNCVVEMEHELKMKGEYEEYEKKKMLANAEAWLKKAEFEKDILKSSIETQFINEDGSIEKWGGLNKDEVIDRIEQGFEKFKTEYIGKLRKELDEKNG